MIVSIDIPDGQVNRVNNAFASIYGYRDKIQDPNVTDVISLIDNPQTKRQFAKQQIVEFIKRTVLSYELDEAKKAISISNVDVS